MDQQHSLKGRVERLHVQTTVSPVCIQIIQSVFSKWNFITRNLKQDWQSQKE